MNDRREAALAALRQIERSVAGGIWDAHGGCAALAGIFILEEGCIHESARGFVEAHVDRLLSDTPPDPMDAESVSVDVFANAVLEELSRDAREPKAIGHDAIYAAYALRAVEVFQIAPWTSLLEQLKELIRAVKRSGAGYIFVDGAKRYDPPPELAGECGADPWESFQSIDRPADDETADMQLGHALTHGHAIETLRPRASDALAADLDHAFRRRLKLLRETGGQDAGREPLRRLPVDPRTLRYWEIVEKRGDMHGHALKYACSFLDTRRGAIREDDLVAFGRIVWPSATEL